jgi:hypothetical protein
MLCANGAASGTPAGIRQAVFAYNHSGAYVNNVLAWAARYTVAAASGAAAAAIVTQRAKQSGMRWTVNGAADIIALRCQQASGRWDEL